MAGGAWAVFSSTASPPQSSFSANADLRAPTLVRAVGARSSGAGTAGQVRQGTGYYIYAQITDAGSPSSGIASVTADTSSFDGGATASALSSAGGPWTVNSLSYNYRTAVLTADTPLTTGSSYGFSISAADVAGNSSVTTGNSVTIETYSSVVLATSGLVSYWRLDESSGTNANDSMSTNDGTYTGGYTLSASGALAGDTNKATTLNGSTGRIAVGNPAALRLSTGTIEAWIKTSNAGTSWRDIVSKDNAYTLLAKANILGTYDFNTGADRATSLNIADNAWHHVVVTFQSGVTNGTKVYSDGTLLLTTTITVTSQTGNFVIGSWKGTDEFWTGAIDEVAMYSGVLTASTISDHYVSGRGS
jgi:hypothetical protein